MSYNEYISQLITCNPVDLKDSEKVSLLRLLSYRNEGIHSYLWFKKHSPFSVDEEKLLSTLVDSNLVEAIPGSRFRRGGRNYVLTNCGLFYILMENQVFSGMLLSKYCESVILQLLLFQYLEVNTVKNLSPRVEIIISEYLHKCCCTSKRAFETIRSSKIPDYKDRYLKILESDLRAYAFCLGIRLTRLYSRLMDISKGELKYRDKLDQHEDKMVNLLAEDDRFSQFKGRILKELDEAYEELVRLKPK
jgi:hypothetical protein